MEFKIESINISNRKGVQKIPVKTAQLVENFGIAGDAHAGSWHRQVSFLAGEAMDSMKNRAAGKLDIKHGDFGENIVTRGIDWSQCKIGGKIVIGNDDDHVDHVELEITQIGKVCHSHCAIFEAVGDCIMPRMGIFARVLKGGIIHVGDSGYYHIG